MQMLNTGLDVEDAQKTTDVLRENAVKMLEQMRDPLREAIQIQRQLSGLTSTNSNSTGSGAPGSAGNNKSLVSTLLFSNRT